MECGAPYTLLLIGTGPRHERQLALARQFDAAPARRLLTESRDASTFEKRATVDAPRL
jgi:hypothetical protein